jgi:hypothetical protein
VDCMSMGDITYNIPLCGHWKRDARQNAASKLDLLKRGW